MMPDWWYKPSWQGFRRGDLLLLIGTLLFFALYGQS